jgi:hypothetical protein
MKNDKTGRRVAAPKLSDAQIEAVREIVSVRRALDTFGDGHVADATMGGMEAALLLLGYPPELGQQVRAILGLGSDS